MVNHHVKILKYVYYYYKLLQEKKLNLQWKHAKKLFYDIYMKDGYDTIHRCIHTLSVFQEYMNRVNSDIEIGIDKEIALKSNMMEEYRRDCIVYGRLLLYLKSFAKETVSDIGITLRFPASLHSNNQFKLLLEKFDRYFQIGFINRNIMSKYLWDKIVKLFYNGYCMIVTHQEQTDREGNRYHDYSYKEEDSLL